VAVRSRRLFGPRSESTGAGQVVLYTVPSGRTLILRSLIVFGRGVAPNTFTVHVNLAASTGRLWRRTLAQNETLVLEEPMILNPGDIIYGTCEAGNVVWFGDGSLLFGAPE
jgi:hypothetical protein